MVEETRYTVWLLMVRTSSFFRMSTDPVTGETLVSQSEDKLVGNALTQKKVGPECGYMGPVALA